MENKYIYFLDGTSGVGKTTFIEMINNGNEKNIHNGIGCLLDYSYICETNSLFSNKSNEPETDLFYQTKLLFMVLDFVKKNINKTNFFFDRGIWSNCIYSIIKRFNFSDPLNFDKVEESIVKLVNDQMNDLNKFLVLFFPKIKFNCVNFIFIDSEKEKLAERLQKRMALKTAGLENSVWDLNEIRRYVEIQNFIFKKIFEKQKNVIDLKSSFVSFHCSNFL